jgi:hypothetical protein
VGSFGNNQTGGIYNTPTAVLQNVVSISMSKKNSFTKIQCPLGYFGGKCQIPMMDFAHCPGNQPCTLYSYGEGDYLGYSGSGDRSTPGLFPIPTNGVVTQISANSIEKHILILMDNSTVYSFGQNGVILILFIKEWSTWDRYYFLYFSTNESELGRDFIRCNWKFSFHGYQK